MITFPSNNLPQDSQTWASKLQNEINRLDTRRIPGPQGYTGLSAYQQAQLDGFTGTESEWLDSLKATFPTPVRYTPSFTGTGLTYTGSGATHPAYNSWYVKHGQMVTFGIQIDCTTVTNFGTGQLKTQLPFTPLLGFNHFSGWVWRDPAIPTDDASHIILNVDTMGVTDIADMHFLVGATATPKPVIENQLIQGAMGYNLTTVSKIYVTGTYISAA
jgi:hypothetical protein